MVNIAEEFSLLCVANTFHRDYFPYLRIYGETLGLVGKDEVVQVVGNCGTGKTTTSRRAVVLSDNRLVHLATDSVVFDASKNLIKVTNTTFNALPITQLILLTRNINRAVRWDEMDLTIRLCKEVLHLGAAEVAVVEDNINQSANALLDKIFTNV